MNPSPITAAVHAALKARIEKERNWTLSSCPFLKRPTKDHFEGRAWAFGKVLEWLKEAKMNHTPGPWLRDGLTIYVLHHNGDYDKGKPRMVNRFSAHVEPCVFQGGSMEEAKANAALIQAAPDMKAALMAIARLLDGAMLPGPIHLSIAEADAIRAALAKTEVPK